MLNRILKAATDLKLSSAVQDVLAIAVSFTALIHSERLPTWTVGPVQWALLATLIGHLAIGFARSLVMSFVRGQA